MDDNGLGLDGEALARIFVPFYTTKVGGCGIGLSLARQIALAHGGQFEGETRATGGRRFTIRLPSRRS